MSVRQYIGARYVLKIYENSVDPSTADWEASVAYEPLTMVNYNNSSYISKKEVPPSVGNPVDNPNYWVLSGLYNGQIASLQTRMQDAEDDIDALQNDYSGLDTRIGTAEGKITALQTGLGTANSNIAKINSLIKRKYLFVGDSYGANPRVNTSWPAQVAAHMHLAATQWTNLCVSGANWTEPTNSYIKQIQDYAGDKNAITDIVIAAGANDRSVSFTDITTAMAAFGTYAAQYYPNARLWLGFIGFGKTLQGQAGYINAYEAYKCCGLYGFAYMANILAANHDYTLLEDNSMHPDATALSKIGGAIATILLGGTFDDAFFRTTSWFTNDTSLLVNYTGVTVTSVAHACQRFVGDAWNINIKRLLLTFPAAKTLGNDANVVLATLNSDFCKVKTIDWVVPGSLTVHDSTDDSWDSIDGYYGFYDNGTDNYLFFHNNNGSRFNIDMVVVNLNYEIPLILC